MTLAAATTTTLPESAPVESPHAGVGMRLRQSVGRLKSRVWGGSTVGEATTPRAVRVPPELPAIPAAAPAVPVAEPVRPGADRPTPDDHAAWLDHLWGHGFRLPGGLLETRRLSSLLPLSPAVTLLQVGRDAGGVAQALATEKGAWVAAATEDADAAMRLATLCAPLGRKVSVTAWEPQAPAFRRNFHHHALALEAFRQGAPATLLGAIAAGLKPRGQLVLLDLITGPGGAQPGWVDGWVQLEGRQAPPPALEAVNAALADAGFEVHVIEDAGARQATQVLQSWLRLLEGLQVPGAVGSRASARALVAEAEFWLLRHRLLQTGALRLLRWHATLRG